MNTMSDSSPLSNETPPGYADALDVDTGTWWRIRLLTPSELLAEGITPMVAVVPVEESPFPPPPSVEAAHLSERLLSVSVAAGSAVPAAVHDAYLTARARADAAQGVRAAAQRIADQGGPSESLAALVAESEDAAKAMQAARAAVLDPANRGPWRAVRVTCDREACGEGVFHFSELPGSSWNAINRAFTAWREASASKLRSFLGG